MNSQSNKSKNSSEAQSHFDDLHDARSKEDIEFTLGEKGFHEREKWHNSFSHEKIPLGGIHCREVIWPSIIPGETEDDFDNRMKVQRSNIHAATPFPYGRYTITNSNICEVIVSQCDGVYYNRIDPRILDCWSMEEFLISFKCKTKMAGFPSFSKEVEFKIIVFGVIGMELLKAILEGNAFQLIKSQSFSPLGNRDSYKIVPVDEADLEGCPLLPITDEKAGDVE